MTVCISNMKNRFPSRMSISNRKKSALFQQSQEALSRYAGRTDHGQIMKTIPMVILLLVLAPMDCVVSASDAMAAGQDTAEQIVSVEVRRRGHDCSNPRNAKRDASRSTPDEAVWELTCDEATYRVKLMPNLGTAKVYILKQSKPDSSK